MGKNFEGKIGESDILEIPVKDPRTTSTIANYINVILDFTNFNPPYWLRSVASLAGAWIKINHIEYTNDSILSHPSRMRGLKQGNGSVGGTEERHIPRGCVD